MAHYAFLDKDNVVVDVIVGIDETKLIEGKEPEVWYGEFRGMICKRTCYNGNYRKNYAIIGGVYDQIKDAFIAPKPFESWVLDEDTCQWVAPVDYPTDGLTYYWDEDSTSWVVADFSEPDVELE